MFLSVSLSSQLAPPPPPPPPPPPLVLNIQLQDKVQLWFDYAATQEYLLSK